MKRTRNTSDDPGYLQLCSELRKIFNLQFKNQYANRLSKQANNCLNRAKILLKQGVAVNNNSEDNSNTPLHYAVKIGNNELVNMLLFKGANVNAKNEQFETPLHLAIEKNSIYAVDLLLKNNADPTIANENGHTPFYFLIKYSDENMINIFVENQVVFDFNLPSKLEFFELAVARNSFKMVNFVFDHMYKLDEEDLNNSTALHKAISKGNKEIVELLLGKGFNVNAVSEFGETPLHCAVNERSEVLIKLLLHHNADVNAKNNVFIPVLHYAVLAKLSANIINNLLEKGADINAIDEVGMSPLNYAVNRENSELVQFLLDKNSDCNDKDNKLAFCLSFVRDMEFNDISSFFEERGYKYYDNFKTCLKEIKKYKSVATIFVDRGFTVYFEDLNDIHIPEALHHLVTDQIDIKRDYYNLQDILNKDETTDRENFDKLFLVYKILNGSVQRGFTEIVHNLLTPSVNVNVTLATGLTLLHYAVIYGHLEIVEKLLSHGADVNAMHKTNKTSALHLSVLNNHYSITSVLLKNNAFLETRDQFKRTPLLLAVQKGNYESSRILLDMGANWNSADVKGITPFNVALKNESLDIAKMLIHYGALFHEENQSDDDDIMEFFFDQGVDNFNLNSSDSLYPRRNKEFMIKYAAFKEINLDLPEDWKMLDSFQIKCHEEISRMMLTRIGESSVSILDLLIKSRRQIAMYMRNEDIFQVLDSMDFKETFPIYESKLRVHVMKGKMTYEILKLSYQCLEDALKLEMPDVIIHKICSYLEDADLRRLIIASPIDDEKKESIQYKNGDEDMDNYNDDKSYDYDDDYDYDYDSYYDYDYYSDFDY